MAASSPLLAQREPQLANDPIGAQDRLQVAMEGIDHDLVIIDCPPSLGLLTVNGLFAADQALVVTEPGAWASDGVQQILRTVDRIGARRPEGLGVAGIVVNRLGRTRDARYWYEQLVETYGDQVLPPVHLRAAIPEAAAQSLPIHGLGARAGAAEAAAEFDALLRAILGDAGRARAVGAGVAVDLGRAGPDRRRAPRRLDAPLHRVPAEWSGRCRSTTRNGRTAVSGRLTTRGRPRSTPCSAPARAARAARARRRPRRLGTGPTLAAALTSPPRR